MAKGAMAISATALTPEIKSFVISILHSFHVPASIRANVSVLEVFLFLRCASRCICVARVSREWNGAVFIAFARQLLAVSEAVLWIWHHFLQST
jgi:hypothetical protein